MFNEEVDKESSEDLVRLPYFDWDKTKYFYYAAKLGSLSAAGKFFNTSQSVISRKVLALEYHLKCKLFVRHSRGIQLTYVGQELFEIIDRVFLDFKRFSYKRSMQIGNAERRIRISSTNALIEYVLTDILVEYNKYKPNLIFELIAEDHFIDIPSKDIDIAIRPLDPRIWRSEKEQNGVVYDCLYGSEKRLYADPSYLNKYGEPKTVEDLKDHRLISHANPDEHPYSDVNWILKLGMPKGHFHKPIFLSTSVGSLVSAAKGGIGIIGSYEEFSIIRDSNLVNILPDVRCKELKEYFIYPEYLKEDQEIMDIKSFLQEKLKSLVSR